MLTEFDQRPFERGIVAARHEALDDLAGGQFEAGHTVEDLRVEDVALRRHALSRRRGPLRRAGSFRGVGR
jgi:hypothetical protein